MDSIEVNIGFNGGALSDQESDGDFDPDVFNSRLNKRRQMTLSAMTGFPARSRSRPSSLRSVSPK